MKKVRITIDYRTKIGEPPPPTVMTGTTEAEVDEDYKKSLADEFKKKIDDIIIKNIKVETIEEI
ncbi:MAG: hypothetical protein ACOC5T_05755 [Elusimicrobiota bacterium]